MGYAIYKRRKKTLLFLTVPFLVSLFFFLIAVVWTIFISFTNQKLTGIEAVQPQIIGLKNYLYILKNSTFINSLTITANFTFLFRNYRAMFNWYFTRSFRAPRFHQTASFY